MIEIKTLTEYDDGFDLQLHIEGDGAVVASQLVSIFNRIYEYAPLLFEAALINCQYTEDHT